MKNVLFIGMTPNQGGIETFMLNVFKLLEGHGFHFEFVNSFNEPLAYSKYIQSHGGIIRKIPLNRSHLGFFTRYIHAKQFFKKHHNYDVVHLNTISINNVYWLMAANKYHIKTLIIHSHDCNFVHKSKLVDFISRILSIENRHFIIRNNIKELSVTKNAGLWMFHNSHFFVINNGINTNLFVFNGNKRQAIRHKLDINNDCKVFITVAKITSQKNYPKIIGIFFDIHKLDDNTKLIIIGDGYEKKAIQLLVNKLDLNHSVIFLGIINNVNEVLNAADLMIMPSKYEGFPFSLIESQAAGVPAVVSSEAVPKESNITGELKYVSLTQSNIEWAKIALNLVPDINNMASFKIDMNDCVKKSKYNINNSIDQIKHIYLS